MEENTRASVRVEENRRVGQGLQCAWKRVKGLGITWNRVEESIKVGATVWLR